MRLERAPTARRFIAARLRSTNRFGSAYIRCMMTHRSTRACIRPQANCVIVDDWLS
jgi:hypothetical protein